MSKLSIISIIVFTGCAGNTPTLNPDAGIVDAGTVDADSSFVTFDAAPLELEVTTLAGASFSGDHDGPRDTALFNNPVNVEVGANSILYVADFYNGAVRAVTSAGDVTTLVKESTFSRPFGLALHGITLFVQTDRNSKGETFLGSGSIWKVDLITEELELLIENIGRPRGMAAISEHELAISDPINHDVRVFNTISKVMTPLAGVRGVRGYADGTGNRALFDSPYDLVVTGAGDLLVADSGNNRIRKVTRSGAVTTYAGSDVAASVDGTISNASFFNPQALALGANDVLYVSDTAGYVVRMVADNMVSTIAGDGSPGYRDGSYLTSKFYGLEGLAVSSDYLFVADGNRGEKSPFNRVRRISLKN